jgi:hypothetical protein
MKGQGSGWTGNSSKKHWKKNKILVRDPGNGYNVGVISVGITIIVSGG